MLTRTLQVHAPAHSGAAGARGSQCSVQNVKLCLLCLLDQRPQPPPLEQRVALCVRQSARRARQGRERSRHTFARVSQRLQQGRAASASVDGPLLHLRRALPHPPTSPRAPCAHPNRRLRAARARVATRGGGSGTTGNTGAHAKRGKGKATQHPRVPACGPPGSTWAGTRRGLATP